MRANLSWDYLFDVAKVITDVYTHTMYSFQFDPNCPNDIMITNVDSDAYVELFLIMLANITKQKRYEDNIYNFSDYSINYVQTRFIMGLRNFGVYDIILKYPADIYCIAKAGFKRVINGNF